MTRLVGCLAIGTGRGYVYVYCSICLAGRQLWSESEGKERTIEGGDIKPSHFVPLFAEGESSIRSRQQQSRLPHLRPRCPSQSCQRTPPRETSNPPTTPPHTARVARPCRAARIARAPTRRPLPQYPPASRATPQRPCQATIAASKPPPQDYRIRHISAAGSPGRSGGRSG